MEAERLFKQALKAGESCYRRSQQLQHHGTQYEAQHSEYNPELMFLMYFTSQILSAAGVNCSVTLQFSLRGK